MLPGPQLPGVPDRHEATDSLPEPAPRPTRRAALWVVGGGVVAGLGGCTAASSGSSAAATTATATAPHTVPSSVPSRTPSAAPTSAAPTEASPSGSAAIAPRIAREPGPDIQRGSGRRDQVALTFHGQGTAAITAEVIAAFQKASAHLTVFAVGTWVHEDPSQVRALAAAGHEVGNHTWSHQPMRHLNAAAARKEIAEGKAALSGIHLDPGWWFRPSGTPSSTPTIRAAAAASGYARCVSYDVDPQDYLDPGAALVRSRIRKTVRPGSIVSLHLGHRGTAEALPGILADLSAVGLAPVTLTTLLRD